MFPVVVLVGLFLVMQIKCKEADYPETLSEIKLDLVKTSSLVVNPKRANSRSS